MRFYFDLHNDIETTDGEGQELVDEAAARRHAEDVARIMAAESVRQGHLDLNHYVEVAGPDRKPLFRIAFGNAVAIRPLTSLRARGE